MPKNVNAIEGDPFSLETRTASINAAPYRPGQISKSGIFEEDGVSTTLISVEMREGSLALVDTSKRGGAGETVGEDPDKIVPFNIPHYQRDDSITADEAQGRRAFGTDDEAETVMSRVEAKEAKHKQDLSMTLEHQRVGAIKGIVTTKSGKVITNLYSAFGIGLPLPVNMKLDMPDEDVVELFQKEVQYRIEDDLDEAYDNLMVWTGRDFHTALWRHKTVKESMLYHSGAANLISAVPDRFEFGNGIFERFKTGRRATEDLGASYIADNEARVVPTGVPGLCITRFAPADYNETVNTDGLPFYSKVIEKKNGKGYDLEVQSNPISLCTRPQALRKLVMSE